MSGNEPAAAAAGGADAQAALEEQTKQWQELMQKYATSGAMAAASAPYMAAGGMGGVGFPMGFPAGVSGVERITLPYFTCPETALTAAPSAADPR
jgi:hypothetical protein